MSLYDIWESPKKTLEHTIERMKGTLASLEQTASRAREEIKVVEADIASLKEKIVAYIKHIEGIL